MIGGVSMKKSLFKITAVCIAVCMLLSCNVYAYDHDVFYDVVLNSGDVVESDQYGEPNEYAEDYKAVRTVTFNATGDEPIIVKERGFMGNGCENQNVQNIIFNGNGEIILNGSAFSCIGITSLEIPSNVKIADGASYVFSYCDYLQKAVIGCSLCEYMFSESNLLKEVEIAPGNKVTEFPRGAFYLCTGLEKINFPETLKKIGSGCFYYAKFKNIDLNEGLEVIDNAAFYGALSCEDLYFPSTLKSIGYMTFLNCDIKNIHFNDGLKTIGSEAFFWNNAVESVTIPDSVTTIGEKAFYHCSSLKSITIPASVTSIGEKAFGYISDSKTMDGVTIYGYRGTAAETYAIENEITFVPLDAESSVKGVTYTPTWGSMNDYSFTVNGRASKIQVIEATEATRTFTRNNSSVTIKGYDAEGNEVDDLSRELDHEVWTVRTRLTPNSDLRVHAKYNNEWEAATYDFSVSTLGSDKTLKTAELSSTSGKLGPIGCKIVTGSGVTKVRIRYEDGMTTTVNSTAATLDAANMTYTYNLTVKPRNVGENKFEVYIKTPSDGWKLAANLTYTAE